MRQISALGNAAKLTRLIGEKFNNDDQVIEREMSASAERVKTRGAEFNAMIQGGVPAQLAGFRKAVGEEMWTTIANNPSIVELLRAWLGEEQRKMAQILVDEFKTLLPSDHDMTDQDILEAVTANQQ